MPLLDCTKRAAKINLLDKSSRTKWEFADAVDCESTLGVDGTATLNGALNVTGAAGFSSTVTATGASSNIVRTGANGQSIAFKQATVSSNMATATGTGTGTITLTGLIPAGALVLCVDARVTTILAGASLNTWSLGVTGDTDRFATGVALAANTTVNSLTGSASNFLWAQIYTAATDVLLTAGAGVFSTGILRVTIHYIDCTPATS